MCNAMNYFVKNYSILLVYLLLNCWYNDASGQLKMVNTSFGKLQGQLIRVWLATSPGQTLMVEQYLGVPYGQPPVGKKRFAMPEMASKWLNLPAVDATKFRPVCPQTWPTYFDPQKPPSKSVLGARMPEVSAERMRQISDFARDQNEDCLYLNLFVPERKDNRTLLPVSVIVHGDSYDWGTGNAYNGTILAAYGQIIVITLNYRLGVLGFLSSGDTVCKGNFALADISCALQFVRTIIGDFNGDPQSITLLGWDRGAALVNLLMVSPISAQADSRLFKRAILVGGTALANSALVVNPRKNFATIAGKVGCPMNLSTTDQSRNELLAFTNTTNCIRSRSVQNLTNAACTLETPTFLSSFAPVVDGVFVVKEPSSWFENNRSLFQGIDLMMGVTTNDAFGYLTQAEVENGVNMARRNAMLRTLVRNIYEFRLNESLNAIQGHYKDWTDSPLDPNNIRALFIAALSDGLYGAPAIKLARLHSSTKKRAENGTNREISKQSNTYFYVFSHETKSMNRGGVSGSVHSEDLIYLIGHPLANSNYVVRSTFGLSRFDQADRTVGKAMLRYVTNFIKFGNPNTDTQVNINDNLNQDPNRIQWDTFETDVRENYLCFHVTPRMELTYRSPDVEFWIKELPLIQKTGRVPDHLSKNTYPLPPPPPTPMPAYLAQILKNQHDSRKSQDASKSAGTPTSRKLISN